MPAKKEVGKVRIPSKVFPLFTLFMVAIAAGTLTARAETPLDRIGAAKPGSAIRDVQLVVGNLEIAKVNLGPGELDKWKESVTAALYELFAEHRDNRDVMVFIDVTREGHATLQMGARPALDENEREAALEKLKEYPPPAARLVDYELAVRFKLNQGSPDNSQPYEPEIVFPRVEHQKKFKAAGIAEEYRMLQEFAREEAIPVLGVLLGLVDDKYEGIHYVSRTLLGYDPDDGADVGLLTAQNHLYWRAVVETPRGDQLIPLSRIVLDVSEGRMDHAFRQHVVVQPFATTKGLARDYLRRLQWMLGTFQSKVGTVCGEAREALKAGDPEAAVKTLDGLLEQYPHSAQGLLAKYRAEAVLQGRESDKKLWNEYARRIFRADPLNSLHEDIPVPADSFEMSKRVEIRSLFRNKAEMKQDLVRYADLALSLGEYGFAAQIYWYVRNFFKPGIYDNRDMVAHFLFCLEKMKVTRLTRHFKGDFKEEFRTIAARLWKERPPR
ncbi:MAG: hypothetical protein ACLFOY_02895 [Desulfatibacillaceae bacterium]